MTAICCGLLRLVAIARGFSRVALCYEVQIVGRGGVYREDSGLLRLPFGASFGLRLWLRIP